MHEHVFAVLNLMGHRVLHTMLRYFLLFFVLMQAMTVVADDPTHSPTIAPGSGFDPLNRSVPNAIAIALTLVGTVAGMLIA